MLLESIIMTLEIPDHLKDQYKPGGATKYPAEILTQVAKPVTLLDQVLVAKMNRIMDMYNGAGLAANQAGKGARVFMIGRKVYANPVLEPVGDEVEDGEEGCLSLPGYKAVVTRHTRVLLKYGCVNQKAGSVELEGWNARVAQHELDHLDGILITPDNPKVKSWRWKTEDELKAAA